MRSADIIDRRLSGKIFPVPQSCGAPLINLIPGGQGQRVYSTEGASTCLTSQGGGWGAKTGLYFVDMNAQPKVTHLARCITARQDSGISNRKGEHSGVLITGARAVINPERETVRQQGRRIKDPDEPMFTLTAMDKHGVEYNGRVRRLMPKECFRLQGFADEQFDKLVEIGIPESQLYKMAGNSVTTNVVTAIAKKLIKEIRKYDGGDPMPNHVINQVKFECPEEKLKEILSAICYGEDAEAQTKGIGTIDFNKIIPMPESLNIESGSYTDRGIDFYLTSVNPNISHLGDEKLSPEEFDTLVNELNSRRFIFGSYRTALTPEEIAEESQYKSTDELIALGKTAITNIQNYGAATWYDWRTRGDTWNTKWNSYNSADYEGGNEICFQTAWSPPHPILMRISEMFPGVYITHQWADEDLGHNCGEREYLNGECVGDIVPESHKDSLEFAASVWGYDLNDMGLYLNAAETQYINVEAESYQLISLFGKPALFSNGRMTEADIPKNLYVYNLCQSSDTGKLEAIEPRAGKDFGGSVITNEPIDLGENGYIEFTDETSPNFIGDEITIGQYMEGRFDMEEGMDIE